ncbi:MAG: hypothetical protein HYY86_03160 [Candidatus Harrisonbacteria bacterium]|nr:hypothetical protein [Candidatus Harrisonbacteria bacterium]
MKKISVNKSDEIAVIVEKIIEAPEQEIVLAIPKFSHLGESLSNFNLLKREADALEKKIIIESVDDHIVELAEMSGLTAINPFFAKNKRQFSDILGPKTAISGKKKPAVSVFRSESAGKNLEEEFASLEESLYRGPFGSKRWKWRIKFPKIKFSEFFLAFGSLAILAILVFAGMKVLPRAKVIIAAQTQEWVYNDSVTTDKSASLDIVKMAIPNQIFSQKKNVSLRFPASGKRQVEKRASGIVSIYNSYSSDPQPLVVQTRFATPDGKLFRLAKGITVPGAKIVEGKIIPSSIEAEVVADKPGPDYNIGPVKLLTIPGFKGTPKYQAFYGELTGNMSGGFVGEVSYPTEDDIKKAKASIQNDLESGIRTALLTQIPKEFKVLDGSSRYKILEQTIDSEADASGSFGIFSESQMTIIAFKEENLKELLVRRARKDNGEDFEIRTSGLEYGLARADFDRGLLSFPVNFKAVLARKIDAEALKKAIAGKSELELKAAVFGLPGLKSATISLWPFWVKNVPTNPEKIKISVE